MNPLLKDTYDLHVHCSPDVIPRAQDVFDLARAADQAGMAGIGLKDHTTSTIGRCHTLNRLHRGQPKFFSSIALNPPVGGLNPAAVEAALASGVDIVYLPTYSAAHHVDTLGESVSPVPHPRDGPQRLTLLNGDGMLLAEVQTIIRLIAEYDAVLATGHVSPRESLAALGSAAQAGVHRSIVTHASQIVPGMSVADQQQAVALGALIEHSFLAVTECCPGTIDLETVLHQIRAVGAEHVILSSDFGQPRNGPPVEAFGCHIERLAAAGLSQSELRVMLRDNPRRLIENRRRRAG
jgi:hypothetical protein